jgi:conjugal transfer pilus assembly protein TraK
MNKSFSTLAILGVLSLMPAAANAAQYGAVACPAGTVFENNAHLKTQMSNTSPNKVFIDGELITGVTGPEGAYIKDNTADGALLITPTTGQDFTIFIETAGGVSVSLDIAPKPGSGRTVHLIPGDAPLKPNPDAKLWEESQPFQKTLVAVARIVANGGIPDSYTEQKASRGPVYNPSAPVQLIPELQLIGSHLRVMRYRMKNQGYITHALNEKQFWQKGVRAVMLSTNTLYANGEGYVWVIFSTDTESGA